jgi:hypothetical protein
MPALQMLFPRWRVGAVLTPAIPRAGTGTYQCYANERYLERS